MVKDILVRSVAAVVVLGCGVCFAFGVAVAAAAHQRGTAIHHYEPVSFAMLWQEASRASFKAVISWVSLDGGFAWILAALGLWFLAALLVAFALAVDPRLFLRSRRAVTLAGWVLGMGSLFGWFGLINLHFTFLNAFALRGLDGEWVIEFGPILDAVGILYLVTLLLFLRSLVLRINGPAPDPVVV
ncbi:MAG TPA: hypothetical protein VF756_14740 [Thermoanaerobaculia bacterium]